MTLPPDLPPAPGPADGPPPAFTPAPPPPSTPPSTPAQPMAPVTPPRGTGSDLLAFDPEGLPAVLVAVGSALVSAAVVVSSAYSRKTGDLDWSNFIVGVVSALGLLGIAGAAYTRASDAEQRTTLVSWPGAFGAVAAGLMVGTLITNDKASSYVGGLVIVALSVSGYLLVRRAPFVLTAIAGLALLYTRLFGDIFDTGGGDNVFMLLGAGILVFVLAITVAGWFLPETRVLSGVVVGVGGLVALNTLLVAVVFARALTGFVAYTPLSEGTPGRFRNDRPADPYKNDVYVVLLFCLVLALVWIAAAVLTGHVGFRLLVVGDAVTVIPLSTVAVMAHHPTWWGAVPALIGGAILVFVGLRAVSTPKGPGGTPAWTASPQQSV